MPTPPSDRRLVYSSESGAVRFCRRCGQPSHEGRCAARTPSAPATPSASAARTPADGIVRLARDRKSRGGKTVTVITGLPGTDADRDAIAKALKQLCGAGGATKDDSIEIQGDQRAKIAAYLTTRGYRVKLAGG